MRQSDGLNCESGSAPSASGISLRRDLSKFHRSPSREGPKFTSLPMRLSTANVPTVDPGAIDAIVGAYHGDPFAVLGMHQAGDFLTVRVFRPGARTVTVQESNAAGSYPAIQVHADGFFEAVIEDRADRFFYELRCTGYNGEEWTEYDPYSFGQILGPLDLHLFKEGQHWELYRHLGAQVREFGGITGVTFAVWAPNAQRVSVVGDFNGWDGRRHPMRKLSTAGSGRFSSRAWAGRPLQIRDQERSRRDRFEERSLRVLLPARHADGLAGLRSEAIRLERWRVDAAASAASLAAGSGQHLRGAPRLLAAAAGGWRPLFDLPGNGATS